MILPIDNMFFMLKNRFYALQFEENIRFVAFSGDWLKLVDGGASESSISHSAAGAAESTHKLKPGRRGRKPLSMVKVTAADCPDKLMDFTWWRGGMLSKLIFQKATLPQSMLKKAARHGTCVSNELLFSLEHFDSFCVEINSLE